MLATERTFPHFEGLTGTDRRGVLLGSKGETLESQDSASVFSRFVVLHVRVSARVFQQSSAVVLLPNHAQG
jgi:hypothetical protein